MNLWDRAGPILAANLYVVLVELYVFDARIGAVKLLRRPISCGATGMDVFDWQLACLRAKLSR